MTIFNGKQSLCSRSVESFQFVKTYCNQRSFNMIPTMTKMVAMRRQCRIYRKGEICFIVGHVEGSVGFSREGVFEEAGLYVEPVFVSKDKMGISFYILWISQFWCLHFLFQCVTFEQHCFSYFLSSKSLPTILPKFGIL